ncbi:MAG: hypothetical protein ABIQ02_06485 [Saprospiraceae bacterium]
MKIKNTFYLAVSFAICTLVCGCGNRSPKDLRMLNAGDILSQYNAGRPNWDWSAKLEGNVKIEATKNLITIHVEADSSGEIISYFLQMENNGDSLLSVPPGKAEVLYLDKHLVVNFLTTKKIVYFKIKSDKKPSYLESIENMSEYAGYGLGMRRVNKGNTLESAPFCSCIQAGSTEFTCPSGGEGALSCGVGNNVGSCKINCSGQTYACCDPRTN